MAKNKNKKAFTIIELIVVMAIIGILVLLAMPKFMGYTKEAKFTKFISNTKQIENASERYYMDKNDWPRLNDIPYTADQLNAFSQKIYDTTGKEVTLDTAGKYYDVNYDKLLQYIKVPNDKLNYVIQNPVGAIYALENLTQEAELRLATSGVLLDKSTLTLNIREFNTLVATVTPASALNKNVIWTSNNINIATVNSSGIVTGMMTGTTTITAKTVDGSYTATSTITVLPAKLLVFNGINSFIQIPNKTILNPNYLTIEASAKFNSLSERPHLVGKGGGGAGAYYIVIETDGTVVFYFDIGLGWRTASSGAFKTSAGAWHKYVGTYDGTNAILYVDGAEVGRTNLPGKVTTTDVYTLNIGAGYNGTVFYNNGQIKEVRLWDYARTQSQIINTSNSTLIGNESGLIGYWKLNESSGNTIYDSTAYKSDGVLYNGSWVIN